MTSYHDYSQRQRSLGLWPRSKAQIFDDAQAEAIRNAAKALGITEATLRSMLRENQS